MGFQCVPLFQKHLKWQRLFKNPRKSLVNLYQQANQFFSCPSLLTTIKKIFLFFFRDNAMNINEFTALIKALFRNEKGRPYQVDNYMITEIFNIFNKQGVSNFLNYDYIKNCYRSKYGYLLCTTII